MHGMEKAAEPTERNQWPRNHTKGHGKTIYYSSEAYGAIVYNPMAAEGQENNYVIPCISMAIYKAG